MKTAPEDPYHDWTQRMLEIMTGAMSWAFFLLLILLSYFAIPWAAYLLIAYILLWVIKILGYSSRLVRGYWHIKLTEQIDWYARLNDLRQPAHALPVLDGDITRTSGWRQRAVWRFYRQLLRRAAENEEAMLDPDQVRHVALISIYNEDIAILEDTIQSVIAANYDTSEMFLVIAYEERGGPGIEAGVGNLISRYGGHFAVAEAVKHPDDIKTKAANITHAATWLTRYIREHNIDPEHVVVTTLDVDSRPSEQYFAELTYRYAITPNRVHMSYQPISMFFNNIWDAPALIRVVAACNSFWVLMEALRPHRLRNFSAHGQSLQTLIDTDYWNRRSIVEDGHQYWRTYFTYAGDHRVSPVYSPIYQDAVLVEGYWRTFKAQFYQLRRWVYGVVDTPYVVRRSFHEPDISWSSKLIHIYRQIEAYFSLAVGPIVLAIGGWLPLLLHAEGTNSVLALQLPTIVGVVQTLALLGLVAPIISSLITIPPRPERYSWIRSVMMVAQWVFVPVTLVVFGSFAALNAQTRVLFGKYLSSFNVTEKKRV
jgi:cellulose synthase/poly-beta-1,6-N-acetylglucosamine synthase-like glycosyltransferase